MNALLIFALAATLGTAQVKEVPLQCPYPEPEYTIIEFNISHYDDCYICCGKADGITASGVKATENHTIAAPKEYAFGTQIEINGIMYTVEDRGGSIKGNNVDIFVGSHEEAIRRGRFTAEGKVYR